MENFKFRYQSLEQMLSQSVFIFQILYEFYYLKMRPGLALPGEPRAF